MAETKSSGLLQAIYDLIGIPWLMVLNLWNHFWNLGIWIGEIRRYYADALLRRADLMWMVEYSLSSPFTLSRKAREEAGLAADLTVYGETPWTTLERVCEALKLGPDDMFVDLGAGTGRTLLFVHYRFGARALGYELVPRFVEKFAWLQHRLGLATIVEMRAQNWFDADLSQGTAFFLVGSCYSDDHLEIARKKLAELPAGSRIASVSYPIAGDAFEPLGDFVSAFSWGSGTVYLQRRR